MKTYKVIVDNDSSIFWYNENDQFHREDGPAIEWADGSKQWFINGKHHREDGPAIEGSYGDKYWFINNKLHREDGPAVDCANGYKKWYINGEELSEQEFINRTQKCVELTIQDIENLVGKRVKIVKNNV